MNVNGSVFVFRIVVGGLVYSRGGFDVVKVPTGVGGGGDEEGAGDVRGDGNDILRVFIVRGDVLFCLSHFHGVISTTSGNYATTFVRSYQKLRV